MQHLTEAWGSLVTASATTWWHVTDNPNFALDPAYKSMTAENEWGESSRRERGGLFITPNPELWLYLWRYQPGKRMYAAEIKPASQPRMLGIVGGGDDRDQAMLTEDEAAKATVVRVVPVEVAVKEARVKGYGFAMLMADAFERSLIHVVNHKKGWGSSDSLCGGYCGGQPLKWTTKTWVLTGPMKDRVCPDCMGKLKRQRS